MDIKKILKSGPDKKDISMQGAGIESDKNSASNKDVNKIENGAKKKNIRETLKNFFKRQPNKSKIEGELKPQKEKIDLKKIDLKKINFKNIPLKLSEFWFRRYKIILGLLLAVSFAGGIFFLYQKTYDSQWSEDKKQQYANSQKREVNFKEESFNEVIKEIASRKAIYEGEFKTLNNIFKPLESEGAKN